MKSFKLSKVAIAVSALAINGAAFAAASGDDNITQSGATHSATLTKGNPLSGANITQSGDVPHQATFIQGPDAGATVLGDIDQEGSFMGHTAAIEQAPGIVGHTSTALIEQAGSGNEAAISAIGADQAGTDVFTIKQGAASAISAENKATIESLGSHNVDVEILQDGAENTAAVKVESGSSDIDVDVAQNAASASNTSDIKVQASDNATIVSNQLAGTARSLVDVTVRSDSGAMATINQTGIDNEAKVQQIDNAGPTTANLTQVGTELFGVTRLKNSAGASATVNQGTAGEIHDSTARVIIEDAVGAAEMGTVTQNASSSEANAILTATDGATATVTQNGGERHLGTVSIENSTGTTGMLTQNGGIEHSGSILVGNDTAGMATITQSGDQQTAKIRLNYTSSVSSTIMQGGDAQIATVKVNGGSVGTTANVTQNSGYRNVGLISVARDESGDLMVNVNQAGELNSANVVVTDLDAGDAGSSVLVNQNLVAGSRKAKADVFLQDLAGTTNVTINQNGDSNDAFAQVKESQGAVTITQDQIFSDARVKVLDGSNATVNVTQSADGEYNETAVELSGSQGVYSVIQVGSENAADFAVTDSDFSAVSFISTQNGNAGSIDFAATEIDDVTVSILQSGSSNTMMVEMIDSTDGTVGLTQTGNGGTMNLFINDSDFNSNTITLSQTGVDAFMDVNIEGADVAATTVTQAALSKGLSATLMYEDVEDLTTTVNQSGVDHALVIDAFEGEDSTVNVTQSGQLGHVANITLINADDSSATVTQTGFQNVANLEMNTVDTSSATLIQGGYGNTMDVTIANDGVTFNSTTDASIDQSNCYGCSATLNL